MYFGDFELLTGSASMLLPFVCEVEAVVGEPSASASPQASAAASVNVSPAASVETSPVPSFVMPSMPPPPPSSVPSAAPSAQPSVEPSAQPSAMPSVEPSAQPSPMPSPSAPPTSVLCPPGWTSFVGSELSCVFMVNTPMTAVDAAAACSEVASGHLVTILADEALGDVLMSLTEGMSVWVGASHNVSEPNRLLGWSWVDGSAGADELMNCGMTGCGAWAAGQPRQVA